MGLNIELIHKALRNAYDVFNWKLFDAQLPACVITLQRRARSYGYVAARRWNSATGSMTDDLVLNPALLSAASPQAILAELVHEMSHVWQHHFGKPSRSGYHNREWATKMISLGLYPSDTGEPGGKHTGQHMSHYIVEEGSFDRISREWLRQSSMTAWHGLGDLAVHNETETLDKAPSRLKYSCIGCGLNAWAKPKISIYCGTCMLELLTSR